MHRGTARHLGWARPPLIEGILDAIFTAPDGCRIVESGRKWGGHPEKSNSSPGVMNGSKHVE
jgi:hypothetical protein